MSGINIIKLKEREAGDNWAALEFKNSHAIIFFVPLMKSFISFVQLEVKNYS